MAAELKRVASGDDTWQHQLEASSSSNPLLQKFPEGVSETMKVPFTEPHGASPVRYTLASTVGLPVCLPPGGQIQFEDNESTELLSDHNMAVKFSQTEVDAEDDFSLIAEEMNKVEAHSQLATVIQRGYGREMRDSTVRFSETLARIGRREGEGSEVMGGSEEELTMFTAERSLHNKLGSSRIMWESSKEDALSHGREGDDVMSEYSASHGVESMYNSFASSQSTSAPGSPHSGKKSGEILARNLACQTEEVEDESPDRVSEVMCTPRAENGGMEEGENVVAVESIDVQAVVEVAMDSEGEEKQQIEEGGQCYLQECNLTPDEQILLRLEEMELKVDFLMNRLQNAEYRVPGYVLLRVPTVDALRTLALNRAKAVTLQLVRSLECFWLLRPLVLAVNVVEDVTWAVFSRLPVVGVPEKQWM